LVGGPVDEDRQRRFYHMVPGVDLDARWRPVRTVENWYLQDREAMKRGDWTGIRALHLQDAACQETMGPITDHARERLGTSDVAIIRLRRRMLDNVRRFEAGEPLIALERAFDYGRLSHLEQRPIPIEDRWQDIQTFPGEYA
jgi:phthalate 4,5-dioxygenase oxygenase subunit